MDKLRVPDKFNLDARNLADAWKRVKLFLYLIGTRGREIYETMSFANAPKNRTLLMVTEAFDNYCHPKRNETVERYRFNMRNQSQDETFDKCH
jgi:hypothetical protein